MLSSKIHILIRYTGIILAFLAGIYFIYFVNLHISSLPKLNWGLQSIVVVIVTLVHYSLGVLLGGSVWYLLLQGYCINVKWQLAQKIFGQAQFGKYLPGNIGHHVGRVLLASSYGVPLQITIQTMLIETVWGATIGAGIALFASLYIVVPASISVISATGATEILFFLVVLSLLPFLVLKIITAYMPSFAVKLTGGVKLRLPRFGMLLQIIALYLLSFLIIGVVLDFHARYLFNYSDSRVFLLTGIYSCAWIAGYLTPGAPAGLGVREAILITALTPLYGTGISIGLTVSLRMVSTLGDGLVFFIALISRVKS